MTLMLETLEVTPVTDRISLFTFGAAGDGPLPAYTAGAHIDFDLGAAGTRSYSLVDLAPIETPPSRYRVAVQREETGQGGSRAMHALAVGDRVAVTPPKNDFALHDDAAPALLIAGGIGITPILSFATALTARDRPFQLHYATRTQALCAFGDELKPRLGDRLTLWFDDTAPIDLARVLQDLPEGGHVYCCGPRGMIDAVRQQAQAQGIAADHIHFELFTTPQAGDADQPFEVEINDGRVFVIPAGRTIVEVLEEEGVDIMYDCQRGDCGICQCDIISGTPDHRDVVLSDAERAAGNVMQICVSRAKSARLLLDI